MRNNNSAPINSGLLVPMISFTIVIVLIVALAAYFVHKEYQEIVNIKGEIETLAKKVENNIEVLMLPGEEQDIEKKIEAYMEQIQQLAESTDGKDIVTKLQKRLNNLEATVAQLKASQSAIPKPRQQAGTKGVTAKTKDVGWLKLQPWNHCTIQLNSATTRREAINFIDRHQLDNVHIIPQVRKGGVRLSVIHGSFKHQSDCDSKAFSFKRDKRLSTWKRKIRGVVQDLPANLD